MSWIEQEMGELVQLNEKIRSAFSAIDAEKMEWKPDRPMRSFGRTKTARRVFYRRPV